MDNSKDFIRLDDVFKNLAHGEEAYRSGSWNKMKELLDKEMPVESTAGNTGVARYWLIPLVALLLAGGGYFYYRNSLSKELKPAVPVGVTTNKESFKNAANTLAKTQSSNELKNNSGNSKKDKVISGNNKTAAVESVGRNQAASFAHAKKYRHTNYVKAAKPAAINQSLSETTGTIKQNSLAVNADKRDARPATAPGNHLSGKQHPYLNQLSSARIVPMNLFGASSASQTLPALALTKTIPTNIIELQESLPVLQKETIIRQNAPSVISANYSDVKVMKETAHELAAANHLHRIKRTIGSSNEPPLYQASNGGFYKEQRDTFKQVDINSVGIKETHLRHNHFKPTYDTVAVKEVASVSFLPLSYAEVQAYHLLPETNQMSLIPGYALTPNAATTLSGDKLKIEEKSNLVPLQNFMVSSHHIDNTHSGFSRFFTGIDNGLSGLMEGNKKWYVSLLVGGNMGLSSPNAYGMQAGASFLYAIAERWTLSLGVNYHKIYFSNYSFWDAAISYALQESSQPNGTLFSGTKYDAQTTVNANSLTRLDFPLLFSYNLGRVSLFAGPEFSWFLPLENQLSTTVQTTNVSKLAYDNKNPFENQMASLDPSKDFRSRLGMGYALGLSYDFSRKLSADVRLNQILWDNTGKYKIDALQSIYHQPAVELNLSFFLGRREKVIYIMDRNRQ